MKIIKPASAMALSLLLFSQSAFAGVHIGMASAVKAKVDELDDKVRSGTFRFLNGATTIGAASASANNVKAASHPLRAAFTDKARWRLSPDKVRFRVRRAEIHPVKGGHTRIINFDSCMVTYDRSLNTKALLLNCPVSLPDGSYREMSLTLDNKLDVLINDDTNSIYTDPDAPTQISSSKPVGGGQFVTFDVSSNQAFAGGINMSTNFSKNLEVGPDNPNPIIQIVVDTTRTLQGVVSGTEMSLDPGVGGGEIPVIAVPFASGVASARIYSGSAHTEFNYEYFTPGSPEISDQLVKVFYESDGQPSRVIFPSKGWPDIDDLGNFALLYRVPLPGFNGVPTYLGRDSNGIIGFATPNDSGAGYRAIVTFRDVSNIGDTTTFSYKATTEPPIPTSGSDYSTGVPAFTPDSQVTLQLIAR